MTFDRVVNIGWVTDADLARLSELPDLKTIHFGMCTVSKLRIDALCSLPKLEAIDISLAAFCGGRREKEDDPALPEDRVEFRLPPLPRLRGLNLWGLPFHGEGLEHLRSIETLDLTGTDVGDDAMPKFESLPNLTRLSLVGTNVTDAGLAHLTGLKHLRTLRVSRDKTTDDGIRLLQAVLPDCRIERVTWSPNMNLGNARIPLIPMFVNITIIAELYSCCAAAT